MRFTCPSCQKSYRLPPERLGTTGNARISCPNCKAMVHVRAGEGDNLESRIISSEPSAPVVPGVRPISTQMPPVPAEGHWYVVIQREKHGPNSLAQLGDLLASGRINAQSLVWQKGMAGWMRLAEVPELRPLLTPRPAPKRPSSTAMPPVGMPDISDSLEPVPAQDAQSFFGKPAGAPQKGPPADAHALHADAHGHAFFGQHDLGDVELQMPDPARHKPTKEEYQSLLQEFSVMFRLDKRTKRQKVAIAVVLATLVLGVIAFGVLLKVDGDRKRDLIRDSKTILAVFSLPYQTSVTVQVGGDDDPNAPTAPGAVAIKRPIVQREASVLSQKLHSLAKATNKKKVAAPNPGGTGKIGLPTGDAATQKANLAEEERLQREAMARKLTGPGGKQEMVLGRGPVGSEAVSKTQLAGMCSGHLADLRACGQSQAGGSSFKARVTINVMGRVETVHADVDGKANADLSRCCESRLKSVNFGPQPADVVHTCNVD